MRGAWLWARSDLRRRWMSLVVVALFIAFTSGATMALVAGARRAGSATERFSSASDLADLAAFVGYDPSDSTGEAHEQGVADLIAALDRDPDVTRYEQGEFVVATPDPVPPGSFGFAYVARPGGGPGLFGTPLLLDGRYPTAADEMLVNERAAKLFDLHVGERHPLLAMACFDCEQERLDAEVTITGIARLEGDLVGDPSTLGLFIVPPTFLDGAWTKYARPGTIVEIHLADGTDPVAVSQRLSPLIQGGDIGNTGASMRVAERAGDLQGNALLVAAVAIGMIGLVVAAQAMGRHISVRRDDEQILLGLGFDRLRRMAAVAAVLAPAVVVGAVLAVPVAVGLSPLLPLGLSRRADPDLGLHLDLLVVGIGALATVVIGVTMVVFVAVRWLQSTAESSSRVSSTLATLAGLGVRPVPLTGSRFALDRGRGSNRLPTRATIAVGVLTVAVVCGAVVMRSSLDGLIHDPAAYGQDWQVRVGSPDGDGSTIPGQLAGDSRIEALDLVAQGALDVVAGAGAGTRVATLGIQGVDGSTSLGILSGRAPYGPGEIALGSESMSDVGVGVGDTITVAGPCGQRSMTVVGRTIVPLVGGDNPDVGSVIDLGEFDALCADELVASIDQNRGALVRLHDDHDLEAFGADLEAAGLYSEPSSRPSSVTSLLDIADAPTIVAIIGALLGSAAIAYALALTVRRRRQDLAILRALGLRSSQAGWVMTWQAMVVAVISIVLGIPIGIGVGRAIWSSVAGRANLVVRPEMPPVALIGVSIGALVVALAASVWPNHRARRLRPARVLRGE